MSNSLSHTAAPLLEGKLEELDRELGRLEAPRTQPGAPVQYGKRAGDHIAESADRLARDRAAAELHHLRDQVVAALGRLEEGAYGSCEVCGRPIPAGRLEALPWAVRCVECASRRRPSG